ncbi:MAG: hypothetical protein IJX42_04930, partial [Oscillospiraceae bacterium]|nr:hypothetical protein [Oscillospiraceae bacterium]
MGDLDIRFSNENDNKKLNNSLDLKLNNGQFQKVEQEKPAPDVNEILKEEYYENLFEEKADEVVETEEEIPEVEEEVVEAEEEIPEAEEFVAEETLEGVTSQLADEIFEEIEAENSVDEEETDVEEASDETEEEFSEDEEEFLEDTIEETEEDTDNTEAGVEDEKEIPSEEKPDLTDEKAIVCDANAISGEKNATDGVLSDLSFDTQKGKYDFINLCVLVIMLLFVALTFIFMKQTLSSDKKNELTVEAIKTGEYTQNISENYYKNLPMEKIMAQAEVLVKKIFGDKDVKFIKFKDNEPPDGPVDYEEMGGMVVEDDVPMVTTTVTTVSGEVTTTGKLPQDFEITTAKQEEDDSPLFTGRPIKTTTTKVTTTLDLPETTEDT